MAESYTTKNITTVEEVNTLETTDKIFVNDSDSLKQISLSNLMDSSGALKKNQGTENAGKTLVVGSDGNVAPSDSQSSVDMSLAIKNQASGAVPIIVTDSSGQPIQDMGMEGRTEQQSTTGAQLLDIDSGTIRGWNIENITNTLEAGQTYTFTNIDASVTTTLLGKNSSGEDIGFGVGYIGAGKSAIFEMPGEVDSLVLGGISAGLQKNNHFMLNSGSEALPWEPYTGGQPSPSPDYPQEIINTGKYNEETRKWEYEVKVTGGNLLDIETGKYSNSEHNNFVNYDSDTGIMNLHSDIYTEDGYIDVIIPLSTPINVVKGKTVFKVFDKTGLSNTSILLLVSDSGNVLSDITLNGTEGVASRNGIATSLRYRQFKTGEVNGVVKIMVSYDQISDYEPYKEPQTVILQSDRPLTKWDRLEKREGQWGWVFKSIDIKLDGSQRWFIYRAYNGFYCESSGLPISSFREGFIECFRIINDVNGMSESNAFRLGANNNIVYALNISQFDDEAEDKGVQNWIDYLSENPITILTYGDEETFVPLTEEEQTALNALHTNYPTTVLMNDQGCEMSLEYVADTKNYIDQNFVRKEDYTALEARVSALESTTVQNI